MAFVTYNPTKLYEYDTGVSKVLSITANPVVGTDKLIITAVSGKHIRIMGLLACTSSGATAGAFNLRDGAGGTVIINALEAPVLTEPSFLLPIVDSGYAETSSGVGLYSNVITADVSLTIFYTTYIP